MNVDSPRVDILLVAEKVQPRFPLSEGGLFFEADLSHRANHATEPSEDHSVYPLNHRFQFGFLEISFTFLIQSDLYNFRSGFKGENDASGFHT